MCGSATLAMLVSSTSMNVASVTVRAMIHGLTAGRHSAAPFMVIAAAPIPIPTSARTQVRVVTGLRPVLAATQPLVNLRRELQATTLQANTNRQARSSHLFKPHLRHHRHPRTQLMPLVLARLEHDLHRYALHNFDVVAGSVFGWQQAEARSTSAGDRIDMPFVGLASRIDRDLSRQPRLHLLELRLFEVSRNPQVRVIKRDYLHHFLPGLHVLTNLDGAVADGSADGSSHLGVHEVKFSLVQRGLLLLGISFR